MFKKLEKHMQTPSEDIHRFLDYPHEQQEGSSFLLQRSVSLGRNRMEEPLRLMYLQISKADRIRCCKML
jgi:hypothetical protein